MTVLTKKSNYLILVLLIFHLMCSKNSQRIVENYDKSINSWKNLCIKSLQIEYERYKSTILKNCYDPNRDQDFDFRRKVLAIEGFPFAECANISIKSEDFDSIYYINKFHHPWDEEDNAAKYLTSIVFKNGKIVSSYLTTENIGVLDISDVSINRAKSIYEDALIRKDGCSTSLLIISKLTAQNKLSIEKIVINPDKIRFLIQ